MGVSTLPRPAMLLCPILHVPRRRAIHMWGYGREDMSHLLDCPHDDTCLMWTGGGKKAPPKPCKGVKPAPSHGLMASHELSTCWTCAFKGTSCALQTLGGTHTGGGGAFSRAINRKLARTSLYTSRNTHKVQAPSFEHRHCAPYPRLGPPGSNQVHHGRHCAKSRPPHHGLDHQE